MGEIRKKARKASIVWSAKAREDLKEIVLYIREDSPEAARRMAAKIKEKTTRLELFPDSGRTLQEYPDLPYREIIIGNYRVIYEHKNGMVEILTVRHGKRLLL